VIDSEFFGERLGLDVKGVVGVATSRNFKKVDWTLKWDEDILIDRRMFHL